MATTNLAQDALNEKQRIPSSYIVTLNRFEYRKLACNILSNGQ